MDLIAYIGTLFTIIALVISVIIAHRQDGQIKKLDDVGTETKNIASALQIDAATQQNIKNFFPQNKNDENKKEEKYKLFFPGDNKQKTLPLINAGDSYGMYVISGLLGADLHLRPIARNAISLESGELDCNAILLCDVNIALKELFGFIELTDLNERKPNKSKLPCWFATYDTKLKYPDSKYGNSLLINIHDTGTNLKRILISPSEESCKVAAELKDNEPFIAKSIQEDYGIIARLSKDKYKYIVIAGIHGYGTLIVASFLDNLIRGKKYFDIEKYQETFFGNNDFISIIRGDFDPTNFLVTRSGILDGYIWVNDDDKEWKLAE